ncbi:MAG TPA: hypothetical protein PL024_08195 [Thauera sp.]|jgi:hypothetical protein|nr:hypothetical protein [Thauera sp.]HRA81470.1 hypothetical protein [Thauera sp.]
MPTQPLTVVEGSRRTSRPPTFKHSIERSVIRAIDAGYRIGQHVWIGHVAGRIVGYNIARYGRFRGERYPLLVKTEFGITKCSLNEVAAAGADRRFSASAAECREAGARR